MIELSKARNQRLLAVHGWSGTLLGLFLYVVVLTGTLSVISHELGIWSAGGVTLKQPLAVPLDEIVRDQANVTRAEWLEEIGIFQSMSGNLLLWLHTHDKHPDTGGIEDFGRLVEVNPHDGALLRETEGWGRDVFASDPVSALEQFIVDLHVTLHLPEPWGLYATGILGFVMLLAAITGLLIHRHLIREVFLSPRQSGALLTKRDRHVLAGTWSLVFAFIVSFTGAFYSFAATVALPVVAATGFGGDQQAMLETLLGVPATEDDTAIKLAGLDAMKATAWEETGTVPDFISISHYGRADARVLMNHPPAQGDLNGPVLAFNGSSGEFIGVKPTIGTEPSIGASLLLLMGPLHFGHFAGLLSKAIWVGLGIAMCYVTLTGLQLWVQRRNEDPVWRAFGHWISVVGVGTPLALAVCGHGFFAALALSSEPAMGTAWTFTVVASAIVLAGVVMRHLTLQLERCLAWGTVLALALLPLTRLLCGGPGWMAAIAEGDALVMGVDLLMLSTAACLALWQMPGLRRRFSGLGLPAVERAATA